ncbi:MAG: ABC transporter permease [Bacteroidota bacterium]
MSTYAFHISLYGLAFLVTIAIGLNFTMLLWFTKKPNRVANRFLALALVTILLWLTRLLCIDIGLGTYFPHWSWAPLEFSLALGPQVYFYVLKITRPDYKLPWKNLLHFVPLLLQLLAHALEIRESIKTGATTYDTLLFRQLSPVLYLASFVSVVIYLYLSFKLIKRFNQQLKFNYERDRYRQELQWLHHLLMLFGFIWLLWIPYTAADYFNYHHQSGIQVYYPLYLFLMVVMIRLAAVAFLRGEVVVSAQVSPVSKSSAPAELKQKGAWLKKAMKDGLYYQDAELSLSSLAEKLNMPPHELSRIINTVLKKSFSDFVNEYRVAEVARRMQDPAYNHITLLGIAYDSGFNSRTTFHRTFKQMTGKSPAEYKAGQQKGIPSYNLEHRSRFAAIISNHETAPLWFRQKLNRNVMFKNYLKIAWRNIVKNKSSSVINISGLAVGMAVTILIGLWIFDELSFNKSFKNYNSIGQVMMKQMDIDGWDTYKSIAIPLSTDLRDNFKDEFKVAVLSTGPQDHIVSSGEAKFTQSGAFMQPEAPDMFTLDMKKGSNRSALTDPHSIILSQSLAEKLFGDTDPVGKLLKIDNLYTVNITGVYKDLPHNTELTGIKFIAPFDLMKTVPGWNTDREVNWNNNGPVLYVQLNQGWSFEAAAAKIKHEKFNHIDREQQLKRKSEVFLQPMSNWHLYNKFNHAVSITSPQLQFVWLYGIIGVFVLLLACINFMNLSTARSEKRAKEVGIRKAVGSVRSQLVSQFYSESLLVALCAFAVSLILVLLALPWFNQVADKQITILWGNPVFWLCSLGFTLFTGLVAGSYPALYLSGFNPVTVLKGTFKAGRFAAIPRKVLVVVQFTVSITLIIGTIIVYRQVLFSKSRPIGYSKEGLIYIDMQTDDIYKHFDAFRNDLLKTGAATDAAESDGTINQLSSNNGGFSWKGKDPTVADKIYFGTIGVSPEFGKTAGWQFIDGRDFSRETVAGDSNAYVINEAAVKYMGLKNPVGEIIKRDGKNFRIIGVIKDVLMESPYEPVSPTVFFLGPWYHATVNIRINPHNTTSDALAKIEPVFKKYAPAMPFDFKFADIDYAKKFAAEDRIGKLAGCFAGLAILISCIGLFGLASFVAEQRTKEVGIRKVLGASVANLWNMLSKDFVVLVLLSCLIAMPAAYYFLHQWLQQYQYRTDIAWWIFATAAGGAITITLFTVSFQAIKAALANPVRSLRSE